MARLSLLLTTYFFFSLLYLLNNPSLSCPNDQKEALLQFKHLLFNELKLNDTDSADASLGGLESWNSSSSCCHWDLVICHSRPGSPQVTGLDLSFLVPYLGPAFDQNVAVSSNLLIPLLSIRTLVLLDISSNNIRGEISAPGFANLTRLLHLDMRENSFNSSIPPQLFSLGHLPRYE